jgi:hypothetical protein
MVIIISESAISHHPSRFRRPFHIAPPHTFAALDYWYRYHTRYKYLRFRVQVRPSSLYDTSTPEYEVWNPGDFHLRAPRSDCAQVHVLCTTGSSSNIFLGDKTYSTKALPSSSVCLYRPPSLLVVSLECSYQLLGVGIGS